MMYNRRVWLNSDTSDSTGSIVLFDGKVSCYDGIADSTFIEIADCRNKIRLHITADDTINDFIEKIKLLKSEIDLFINYLNIKNEKTEMRREE